MTKIKWNWGTGIVLFIIFFILMNVLFGLIAINSPVDLVRKDYYESELKYQQVIDKKDNYDKLTVKPIFMVSGQTVTLTFPDSTKKISGTLKLYRPSNAGLDTEYNFFLENKNTVSYTSRGLIKGFWKAKIEFKDETNEYYTEQEFFISG